MSRADQYLPDYKWSPSQISTWIACPRKWAFTYLLGIRGPSTPGQALGTRVHKVLESYAEGHEIDTSTKEGEIAIEALPLIPEPPFAAEHEFHVYGRHHWSGRKDFEIVDGQVAVVGDYKTTSDLKWAKTPEQLEGDPQAIVYAHDTFSREIGAETVDLHWVYLCTRRPRGKRVHLRVLREETAAKFELLEQEADKAREHLLATVGLDDEAVRGYIMQMPYNGSHCEAYGGCLFRGVCNLTPAERFSSHMTQAQESVFAKIQAIRINPPAVAPTERPTEPAAPQALKQETVVHSVPEAAILEIAKETHQEANKTQEMPRTDGVDAPVFVVPKIEWLFIGCLPVQGSLGMWVDFSQVLANAKSMILREFELADYRFAEYGRGPGLLLAAVKSELDKYSDLSLVVDPTTPEWSVCASEVRARAKRVVIGL